MNNPERNVDEKLEWNYLPQTKPEQSHPCEYQILVSCRGWYRPNAEEPRFASDERYPPVAQLLRWRDWEGAETFEVAVPIIRELREKKQAEAENG